VTVTVGAAISGTVTVGNFPATQAVSLVSVPTHAITGTVTVSNISSLPDSAGNRVVRNFVFGYDYTNQEPVAVAIDGTSLSVAPGTINGLQDGDGTTFGIDRNFPVDIVSSLPAGTNRIGVVTIGAGTVTIGAGTAQIGSVTASISNFPATQAVSLTTLPALVSGTAQIGSVTASISGTVPISISSVTIGNSVTIGSLPALAAGTAQIGSVTASLAISSSAITSGSFTSLTSATLVPANTARKMATVYNLGAGQLFINAGSSATTLGGGFMVALSSGDFYECDYTTTTLSAIFATAGTASWISH
jgi:hypothetical protein